MTLRGVVAAVASSDQERSVRVTQERVATMPGLSWKVCLVRAMSGAKPVGCARSVRRLRDSGQMAGEWGGGGAVGGTSEARLLVVGDWDADCPCTPTPMDTFDYDHRAPLSG